MPKQPQTTPISQLTFTIEENCVEFDSVQGILGGVYHPPEWQEIADRCAELLGTTISLVYGDADHVRFVFSGLIADDEDAWRVQEQVTNEISNGQLA